jgi:hypothetical protein
MQVRGELLFDYDGVLVKENSSIHEKSQHPINLEKLAEVLEEANKREVNVRVLTSRSEASRPAIQAIMNRAQRAAKLSREFPDEYIHCIGSNSHKTMDKKASIATKKALFIRNLYEKLSEEDKQHCLFIDDTKLNTDEVQKTGVQVHFVDHTHNIDMAAMSKLGASEQAAFLEEIEKKEEAHFERALNFVRTFPTPIAASPPEQSLKKDSVSTITFEEKINAQLQGILIDTKYWNNKTHYQFFGGGVGTGHQRVPTYIAKMRETKHSIAKLAEIAEKSITPSALMRRLGRKESCPSGRNEATHKFYKMLITVNNLMAADTKENKKVDEIEQEIQRWKNRYFSPS